MKKKPGPPSRRRVFLYPEYLPAGQGVNLAVERKSPTGWKTAAAGDFGRRGDIGKVMDNVIDDSIRLREPEGIVDFRREDLYRYAGPRALIASALSFRLMKEAIARFSGVEDGEGPRTGSEASKDSAPLAETAKRSAEALLSRKEFWILSSHAGPGVRDGFELMTRAVTDRRYFTDTFFTHPLASPAAAGGAMVFEIGYRPLQRSFLFVLSNDLFGKEWFDAVSAHQEGSEDEKSHARYLAYKYALVGKILALEPVDVFAVIEEIRPDERFWPDPVKHTMPGKM